MAGVLGPASQRINADVAGLTHVPEPNPGAPQGAVLHEITEELLPTEKGGLEHIFTDHMPTPAQIVERAVTQPTSSVLGRLGGLVPKLTTPQVPGPAVGAYPAGDPNGPPGFGSPLPLAAGAYPGQAYPAGNPNGPFTVSPLPKTSQIAVNVRSVTTKLRQFLGL